MSDSNSDRKRGRPKLDYSSPGRIRQKKYMAKKKSDFDEIAKLASLLLLAITDLESVLDDSIIKNVEACLSKLSVDLDQNYYLGQILVNSELIRNRLRQV